LLRINRNASITGSIWYITTTNDPSNKPNLPSGEKRRKPGEEFSYISNISDSNETRCTIYGIGAMPTTADGLDPIILVSL